MIKVCILFGRREINLVVTEPPKISTDRKGKITGMTFSDQSARDFARYIDWSRVEAVIQYPEGENMQEEGAQDGQETN